MKTWKVIEWKNEPESKEFEHSITCPNCGTDAVVPMRTGVRLLAQISIPSFRGELGPDPGIHLVYDHGLKYGDSPDAIECRKCHRRFGNCIKEIAA